MATARITLSAELSPEQLQGHVQANAGYFTRGDTVMAENYIDAAEALLAVPISEVEHSGERVRQEVRTLQERLDKAIDWLAVERACSASPRQYVPSPTIRDE